MFGLFKAGRSGFQIYKGLKKAKAGDLIVKHLEEPELGKLPKQKIIGRAREMLR
jgi:hypothetical protein